MENEIVNLGVTEQVLESLKEKYLEVPDASTKEGYAAVKAAKSDLTPYVTGVEKERKIQVRDALDHQKMINAEAKRVTALLEELRQPMIEAKKFIDDEKKRIEEEKINTEIKRIDRIKSEIAYIVDYRLSGWHFSASDLVGAIHEMEIAQEREGGLDEFYDDYHAEVNSTKGYFEDLLEAAKEKEQLEKDKEETRIEREKLEAEKAEVEREKQLAREEEKAKELRIKQKAHDKEIRKQAVKDAEMRAEEAKKQAEIDKIKAEEKRLADIEQAKQDERNKLIKENEEKLAREKAEKAKQEAALKRKQENKAHIEKINNEAIQSFIDDGETEHDSRQIVFAISSGRIKNVTINY